MGIYGLCGIILCFVLFGVSDVRFANGKMLPQKLHVRHEGGHRQFHKTRHSMEERNEWTSRNRSRVDRFDSFSNDLSVSRRRRHNINEPLFEVEVNEVRNTSICSYTVEPVEDESGNWILKNLQHIKCNKVGNKCHQGDRPHCCIQTYKMINLNFSNNAMYQKKIYTGCVCAYSAYQKIKPLLNLTD